MVYGRKVRDQTLAFEASGALLQASLVMRDRETDSWWSIMSSDAIGGPLEGEELRELPVGQKAEWGQWKHRYPETLVLSVEGVEHVAENPYEQYFTSDRTFRGLEIDDDRLESKEAIYAMWIDGRPWAIPHEQVEGGALRSVAPGAEGSDIAGTEGDEEPVWLLLYRAPDAPIYASTEAWRLEAPAAPEQTLEELLSAARRGVPGFSPIEGFDTFWYTWVAVQEETGLLSGD